MKIDISGKSKAVVLTALYNRAGPVGLGSIDFDPRPMLLKDAEKIIKKKGDNLYFNYLKGRCLKVDLSGDELETFLYDRDNGYGAAENALKDI